MKTTDFYFDLPPALIAQHPLKNRSDSRLLIYHRQEKTCQHRQFCALPDALNPGDLLVLNDTKVIPARFYGHKSTGGRVEFLVERLVDTQTFWSQMKASKSLKPGQVISLEAGFTVEIIQKQADLYLCKASDDVDTLLATVGHIPLPPYINRLDTQADQERYQTVYARHKGSVAAPTAGLHFEEKIFNALKAKGIQLAYTTLHVGAGTFQTVRAASILDHQMHTERMSVSADLCAQIAQTKANGNRVIAVGTTALRALESAVDNGLLRPVVKDTAIFIYPGFRFQVCDGLLTNFHLPESTLLMLVAAFIGHQEVLSLYQEAIAEQYRFFSYGDASLLL